MEATSAEWKAVMKKWEELDLQDLAKAFYEECGADARKLLFRWKAREHLWEYFWKHVTDQYQIFKEDFECVLDQQHAWH